ncbi:MAG: SIMPL domain-containing protein [Actinobacteria bacterium]|nr:SIMPL domain-containing protein [Actinomycetota bacterium]
MKRILIVLTSLIAVAGLAAIAAVVDADDAPAAAAATDPGGITAQGTGSVTSVPDRATLSFGVESQGETARAALTANANAMRRVIAALEAANAGDLTTQSVSLSPRYVDKGAIQGYVATNTVSATVKELGRVGDVIDAAVDAGANQVYGPSLSRENRSDLYREALKKAVAHARANAVAIASAADLSLGRVISVVEGAAAGPPTLYAMDRAAVESTPIEPGTQEISATVTVTFAVS